MSLRSTVAIVKVRAGQHMSLALSPRLPNAGTYTQTESETRIPPSNIRRQVSD